MPKQTPKQTSEYAKLIRSGAGRVRKKKMSAAEAAKKTEEQQRKNRMRQEARRRALMVLQHRYAEEYAALYVAEQQFLNEEPNK